MNRLDLESFINNLLKPELFEDYCPNGLQIEGKDEIKKIVFAVSATKESIDFSVENKADALVVHHGLFWKFHGTKTITGPFSKRVKPLIQNDINLFGYHLPLDGHESLGNAASLAKLLELEECSPFGIYKGCATGVKGVFKQAIDSKTLIKNLTAITNHSVLYSNPADSNAKIKNS